jgi:RNA polymerase sigma-70 factor (ECF subfamily)
MTRLEPDTEELLAQASRGNSTARSQLLAQHRGRLRQMVAARMDRRLAARFDPSDVVQEVLLQADRHLADYLEHRPIPFYPWLRQFAVNHLIDLHRRHLKAGRRSVTREEMPSPRLPDESADELVERLFARDSSPSARLEREEVRQQVRQALEQLPERDRELLVLRHLERLSTAEIAAVLGVSEATVYTRHLRALKRLGELLKRHHRGEPP